MKQFRDTNLKVDSEGKIYGPKGLRKDSMNNRGYLQICTTGKTFTAHRIVAETLIPNPHNKEFVNHKDGNKINNHPSNLEWVTPSENNIHAKEVLGTQAFQRKLTKFQEAKVRELYITGRYSHNQLAGMFGVSKRTITVTLNQRGTEGRTR